ncbi:mersacidin/lichenicidin family type 2 lantibiotic [Streptomyces rubiginosohelvolus]|uniref:mersacidin/lichenicidin family type 2 lantibiotic n=1 Tax=Streptomyces rubiginosohelvolus TaxID=67362 RepID=UPI003677C653
MLPSPSPASAPHPEPQEVDPDLVVRAWKDPLFRASLNETERAALPHHPAGGIDAAQSLEE